MREVAANGGIDLIENVSDETVLLESGLDSFGFAVLVVTLEDVLGYDPFSLMDKPYYPRTFGEFVEVYKRFAP